MNIRNTTLEQWRVFQTIVEKGGFKEAADHLYKSQSTISYTIKKLQQQLGKKLFRISGKTALLTREGILFLERSRLLIEQADALQNFADNMQTGWENELRIVFESVVPKSLLSQALQKFEPLSKGCRIQLDETVLSATEGAIEDPKNDIVLSPFVPTGYFSEPLINIDFIAVCAPQNPLLKRHHPVNAEQLKQSLQIVVRDSDSKQSRDMVQAGSQHRWTVSSLEAAKSMIINGLGYAWLPEYMVKDALKSGNLVALPVEQGKRQRATISLVLVKQEMAGPASRLMANIFSKMAQKAQYKS